MTKYSTRDRIVEEADELFYESGFEATSFADIADVVGISRGNFYYQFRTKDEILEAVINRRRQATRDLLDRWQVEGVEPRDRVVSFIRILVANRTKIMAFGCPVGTLCAELAKLGHIARDGAAEIFGLFRDWLAKDFPDDCVPMRRLACYGGRCLPMESVAMGSRCASTRISLSSMTS